MNQWQLLNWLLVKQFIIKTQMKEINELIQLKAVFFFNLNNLLFIF